MRAQIAQLLAALSSHYYRPDFTEAQSRRLIADMVQDLEEFPVAEIEAAIRQYRRDPKSRFFPTSGALRGLIAQARRERAERDRLPRKIKPLGRPLMWWTLPRSWWSKWSHDWKESEVPAGELIRDVPGGPFRQPQRHAVEQAAVSISAPK
jgi:hypothetical protein